MAYQKRLTVNEVDPGAYQSILAMERYVRSGTLDHVLVVLLRLRASQLNGCAYCLDMHAAEARAAGVEQRRLDILSAWREAPSFLHRSGTSRARAHRVSHPHRRGRSA